ncbi:anaerobic glycerol-3-phosphate dehydrogenase subunit GlpA [Desulfovibrio inopinatus]|uniref:anaerobic glycerol-3-phosphate dehydrogenase subunit GlpA n=1 Tax=Desulfovibrio inopinatus TaxID=102109 RepID=UPI0004261854|nr:anaerobic glycerol-3-phosphate dehydrogenase subunit GlpA [Desulfovibrio inopinatus]
MIETIPVLVIGGGSTGTGIARDLALRGVPCLLIEKRDINSGASGGNHGLLHSGARYVASDMEAAVECRDEGDILRRVAPQCIDDCGGLFVAVPGDDEGYIADFPGLCDRSGIGCKALDPQEARELEPVLAESLVAAYRVQDASIDPFMLSLDNMAHAMELGARVRRNTRVTGFDIENGCIKRVRCCDDTSEREIIIEPELVVNASGAWAGLVAAMAGAQIEILYSMGELLVTQDRLATRVINRLRPASDSDILVPGGAVSILGTTSVRIDHPDLCRPSIAEADAIIDDAKAMVPLLETTRYIRAYSGVRPLVKSGNAGDDRSVSRGFALIDHAHDGVENFVTITGGKLTTYRLMAEKTCDLVCAKLGVSTPCSTQTEPLPASEKAMWTEPGRAPRTWVDKKSSTDLILCECEMVSAGVIASIVDNMGEMRGRSLLKAVGQRSRVGKGPCQGGLCGLRITGHLYDSGRVTDHHGLHELRRFVERRWRGFAPVLWGASLRQAELQDALYCGMLDLELEDESAS